MNNKIICTNFTCDPFDKHYNLALFSTDTLNISDKHESKVKLVHPNGISRERAAKNFIL